MQKIRLVQLSRARFPNLLVVDLYRYNPIGWSKSYLSNGQHLCDLASILKIGYINDANRYMGLILILDCFTMVSNT